MIRSRFVAFLPARVYEVSVHRTPQVSSYARKNPGKRGNCGSGDGVNENPGFSSFDNALLGTYARDVYVKVPSQQRCDQLQNRREVLREDGSMEEELIHVRCEEEERVHREQRLAVVHGDVVNEEVVQDLLLSRSYVGHFWSQGESKR